jgi:hypothetical protein
MKVEGEWTKQDTSTTSGKLFARIQRFSRLVPISPGRIGKTQASSLSIYRCLIALAYTVLVLLYLKKMSRAMETLLHIYSKAVHIYVHTLVHSLVVRL